MCAARLHYSHGSSGMRHETHSSSDKRKRGAAGREHTFSLKFEQRGAYANYEFDIPKIHRTVRSVLAGWRMRVLAIRALNHKHMYRHTSGKHMVYCGNIN